MIPKDLRLLRDIVALFPGQAEETWRDRARRGTGPNVYRVSGKYLQADIAAAAVRALQAAADAAEGRR